jgi:MFS-type transporter involved in bile tolerance (Atg22 family)
VWREVRGVSLIHNERTKLLALAFNTAATSAFTVGVLAPVAAAVYDLGASRQPPKAVILGAFLWIGASVVLHLAARRVLGWLKP